MAPLSTSLRFHLPPPASCSCRLAEGASPEFASARRHTRGSGSEKELPLTYLLLFALFLRGKASLLRELVFPLHRLRSGRFRLGSLYLMSITLKDTHIPLSRSNISKVGKKKKKNAQYRGWVWRGEARRASAARAFAFASSPRLPFRRSEREADEVGHYKKHTIQVFLVYR